MDETVLFRIFYIFFPDGQSALFEQIVRFSEFIEQCRFYSERQRQQIIRESIKLEVRRGYLEQVDVDGTTLYRLTPDGIQYSNLIKSSASNS